jgi:hypothetical protein
MTSVTTEHLETLRANVRAAQHSRSLPLIIVGALLLNYGLTSFAPQPVAWRYGAPLAFVLIWALAKLNEARAGVGAGRFDYLVAAGFVFTAVNVLLLRPFSFWLNLFQLEGLWVATVGIALVALAVTKRDAVLRAAAGLLIAIGAVIAVATYNSGVAGFYRIGTLPAPGAWPNQTIALTGVALAIAGLFYYRREREQL